MKLIFTQNFNITTDALLIRREDSTHAAGDGIIPADVAPSKIVIQPVSASDALMTRGINEASEWITLRAGDSVVIENFRDAVLGGYVKSGGTVSANMLVYGQ